MKANVRHQKNFHQKTFTSTVYSIQVFCEILEDFQASISANIVESFQYKMPALNSQSVILLKKDSATGEFVRGF